MMSNSDTAAIQADILRLVDDIQCGDQSPEYYVAAIQAVIDDAAKADWSKHGATKIALGQWESRALAAEAALAAERERCAKVAEGPEFWPSPKQPGDVLTYRGTKDGNWLAVKPPFKLDPYSQGRADAAAAIRAQGE